jgi:peptidoglycan-associated lipoprotein
MRGFSVPIGIALAVAACAGSKPAPTPEPAPQAVAQPPPAPPPAAPATPPPPRAVEVRAVSIYFEFDSSDLSSDARSTLQSFYDQARQRPDLNVRVEGNCDERGSAEYNLALGQRRADAAKTYLVNLGLPPARITAISNGEERPRATGHDESAWRENRRDDVSPGTGAVGQTTR